MSRHDGVLDALDGFARDFAQTLLARGLVDPGRLRTLIETAAGREGTFHLAVQRLPDIDGVEVARALAHQLELEFSDLAGVHPSPKILMLVPAHVLQKYCCLPLSSEAGHLRVAMADPLRHMAIDDLALASGMQVQPVVAPVAVLEQRLELLFPADGDEAERLLEQIGDLPAEPTGGGDLDALADLALADLGKGDAPIIRLVNLIVAHAVEMRATEITMEPAGGAWRVRFRGNGRRKVVMEPPLKAASGIIQRLKVMAGWRVDRKPTEQQPRIRVKIADRAVSLRLTVTPTVAGDVVHLAVLDHFGEGLRSFVDLGMAPTAAANYESQLAAPGGGFVILVGPRGAGKTLTLYSSVLQLRNPERKIMTVESAIEADLADIDQVQLDEPRGLDSLGAVRACLQHRPDVLLIDDLRSRRVAKQALAAAIGGTTVLAGLTVTDVPAAWARLLAWGLDRGELAAGLRLVVNQRLVRTSRCRGCRQELPADAGMVTNLGFDEATWRRLGLPGDVAGGGDDSNLKLFRAPGCEQCADGTGIDRTGVFELVEFDDATLRPWFDGRPPAEVYRAWRNAGGITLPQAAARRAILGEIPFDEALNLRR